MENNLFYSRENNREKNNKSKKFDFSKKKENAIHSLNEVEHFLGDYKRFLKYIKLYNFLKWLFT